MLEVVFSQSAAGTLSVAQTCPGDLGGPVSLYSERDGKKPSKKEIEEAQKRAEERIRKKRQNAVPIGGKHEDIFCFPLGLSQGEIRGDVLSGERLEKVKELYSIFPEETQWIENSMKPLRQRFQTLTDRAKTGETVRIWYSEAPDEYCGLCWFLSELQKNIQELPKMTAIRLPPVVLDDENAACMRCQGWGDVPAEDYHRFLPLEKPVLKLFVTMAAAKWQELQSENGNLRAVINGEIYTVPENFYDSFILREIEKAEDPFHEARLIGTVLGKYQLGIGDMWVAIRIEKMIEDGILTPVTQPKHGDTIYRRMLGKRKDL